MTRVSNERLLELQKMARRGWNLTSSTGSLTHAEASALIEEVTGLRASAPESETVDWSYDLTSCPKSEPFLIAYADGDVRMGHYLDNSKSSVPWEGIRPLFGAERWDARIIAWAKRPALATREEAPTEVGVAQRVMNRADLTNATTPGHADAYLNALLDYTAGFYSEAREAGMPAASVADAMNHVERAARGLHALALRAQPPAREDAQPVARVSRKGNATGSLVWTDHGRASDLPDDAALFSALIIEGRSKLKREIYDNLCAADNQDLPLEDYPDRILSVVERYTHPAPGAPQIAVDALTAISEVSADRATSGYNEAGRLARIHEHATETLDILASIASND